MLSTNRAFHIVLVVFAVFGVSGCTADSQLPDGVVLMKDREPDRVVLTPPKGWDCHHVTDKATVFYECKQGDKSFLESASLQVRHVFPHFLSAEGDLYDVADKFRFIFIKRRKGTSFSDLSKLPERLIGGEKAYGQTYIYVNGKERVERRVTKWLVGRSDGFWYVDLRSEYGSLVIPPELVEAVDTIHWVPVGGSPDPKSTESEGP